MKPSISRRFFRDARLFCGVVGLLLACLATARVDADEPLQPERAPYNPHVDVRWGGALETSYQYHRHAGEAAHRPQPGAPYRYGFPVSSYRWGWFGASRYYPTVVWHRGFHGDECRWAYRHGY